MRKSLQIFAFVCTLMINAASTAAIVTQTVWFKDWLRGVIVRQADKYVNGDLAIGRLEGNLLFGVRMANVDITMNGRPAVAVKDIDLDYSVLTFLRGHLTLDRIHLDSPTVHLERTASGWNLTQLIKARTPTSQKNRRAIEIAQIVVTDGTLYVEGRPAPAAVELPRVMSGIDASVAVRSDANALTVDLAHAAFHADDPALDVRSVSGVIRRQQEGITLQKVTLLTGSSSLHVDGSIRTSDRGNPVLDLHTSSEKLSMREVASLVPALRGRETLEPAFDINARGPLDHLNVQVDAHDRLAGRLGARMMVDAKGPARRVAGEFQTQRFNVGMLFRGTTLKTDVTTRGTTDLMLPSGPSPLRGTYTMTVANAAVAGYEAHDVKAKGRIEGRVVTVDAGGSGYGGYATAVGTIRTDAPLTIDFEGRAEHVDLRKVPRQLNAPDAPSDLRFGYTLKVRSHVLSGGLQMGESTLAGATISPGTIASFKFGDGAPEYSATGHVDAVDLQQIGRGFDIAALDQEKFQSRLGGTVDMKGKGGGRYPLTLEASGTALDSEIFRASVHRLEFTASFDGGDARITGDGQFAGFDPAVPMSDDRVSGSVSGAGHVDVTLRGYAEGVTRDSIDVSGRVDLGHSLIRGLAIDTGVVDGAYGSRVATANEVVLDGPDLHANAHGTMALNETGSSDVTVHAEMPSLTHLGRLIDRSDLTGGAIVDAQVTGNATELKAKGTLKGNHVAQGKVSALDIDSTFDASLPDLSLDRATIRTDAKATFVRVAGQDINELTASATFSASKLDFDGVAKQGVRQLSAKGSVLLDAEQNTVHIDSLALQSEQAVWKTDPASHPTLQYDANRLAVDDVTLVNGDQRIEAMGAMGGPSDTLHIQAANVDVAQIDVLTLGDQRLSGRLDADATVSGTTSDPKVAGQFALAQGAFRGFMFDSLGGTVHYGDRNLLLDVRLDKGTAWLTAKGTAPLSLFRPNPAGTHGEHIAPGAGEAIDVQIASSPIDLALIQGFTSYITKVTGTMEANFNVTGSGYDPHLDGVIDIKGGAFTAPDLGMSYTGLDTHVDLKPDEVAISEFKILDNDKHWLTIGGSLAVHEREVGAVDIKVKSDDFKVINNRTADLKLDSDFHITGTVRAPRVEGTVEVGPGVVDVGEVLDLSARRPYSTTPTDLSSTDASALEPTTPLVPGIFDSTDLQLSVAIPGDLLLKGNDIRTAGASIDAGSMSIFVGGAVGIVKPPQERIRLTGEVNTVRGSYTFQGRRFEVMRDGRIRFQGSDIVDPIIELQARRVISGVEAFVHLSGTLLQPQLSFTSNPPLEESDILSLILFNTPINELGAGQQASLAVRAQDLAGSYLTSGLSQSIGNMLNLSEFEIQTATVGGVGPSITVGEQLSNGLFVRVRQGFGSGDATEFIIEKQLASFLRLQGTVSDVPNSTQLTPFRRVERGGIDLLFFFNY